MRWSEASEQYCSVARTLGLIGERWTLLVIREAFDGVRRFDDFQAHLDIARNVLTDRLQRLVDAGVLEKRRYQEKPPRYEYRLTEAGRDLFPVISALMAWGDRWAAPDGAPVVLRHSCGEVSTPGTVCSHCGEPLTLDSVRLKRGPGWCQESRVAT